MKQTELVNRLKELLEASTNDDVLEAVEGLVLQVGQEKPWMPFGIMLMANPNGTGEYRPVPFSGGNIGLKEAKVLHDMCVNFASAAVLPAIEDMKTREIEARVRAELEQENNDA